MSNKPNQDIRNLIRNAGVFHWMVAQHLGISEATFTRWLRRELSSELRQQVQTAINELTHETQSLN